MKDSLPTIVMNQPGARPVSASSGINSASQSSQTALFGSLQGASNGEKPGFASALMKTLQATAAQQQAGKDSETGGNNLPLAAPAAEPGLRPAISGPAELQAGSVKAVPEAMALLPGLEPDSAATTLEQSGPLPADAATEVLPAATPFTTAAVPGTVDIDNSQHAINAARDVKPPVALQGLQIRAEADLPASAETILARMHLGAPGSSADNGANSSSPTVRAALTPSAVSSSIADASPATKTDAVVNETDLLFTSRIRQSGQPQPAEMTGYRLTSEALMSTNQLAVNETQQAWMNRSPIMQAPGAGDSLTSPPSATSTQASITEAFGKPEWGQGMGRQVMWMVNQNISRAEIRLNPANLGPIEVRIEMENDQVNVAFSSRHADVREAVEQALPRLREMLEEKGLNLSDTDVSQHSFAQQQQGGFDQPEDNRIGFGSNLQQLDEADQNQDAVHGMNGHRAGELHGEGLIDLYI